jgi:deoxynucleoside kinase
MYKQPEIWAMPFQTYVTLTMLNMHTMRTPKSVKLMERSLFSARFCFVENMVSTGMLHRGMYNILNEWYEHIEKTMHIQADLIVYLRTTPEIVYQRMMARGRGEESCVPLEYLKQLHALHEDWLIHGTKHRPAPVSESGEKARNKVLIFIFHQQVLVLDADLDLNNIGSEYVRSENSILKPILIENTNQQPILASPNKRNRN